MKPGDEKRLKHLLLYWDQASQYTYVEVVENQRTEELFFACENALHYCGGAPLAIVPDNLKAAVIKSSHCEPKSMKTLKVLTVTME